jgi:hypothetical protein
MLLSCTPQALLGNTTGREEVKMCKGTIDSIDSLVRLTVNYGKILKQVCDYY